jgi:PIN domain nuclease of toxin-antitoxin system
LGSSRNSAKDAELISADMSNVLYFSPASIREICIKNSLGRKDFKVEPEEFWRSLLGHHYLELAIISQHTLALKGLPPFHKYPFDRILIAQAMSEDLIFLTSDTILQKYSKNIICIPKS